MEELKYTQEDLNRAVAEERERCEFDKRWALHDAESKLQ